MKSESRSDKFRTAVKCGQILHGLAAQTGYRDDIAHFWTGNIDGNYLANMYRTINELLRRRYF